MKKKNIIINIAVLLLYIAITLFATLPVVLEINQTIPSNVSDNDSFQLITYSENLSSKYIDSSISNYYKFLAPNKIFNIKYQYFIIHQILGEPLAYNLVWLLSFILSALGAYLLVKYLTKNYIAAFLAGYFYSFIPYHFYFAEGGHFGAMHIEFLPFFVLFLLKFIDTLKFKHFFLTGIFALLIVASESHYAVAIGLFVLGYFVYLLVRRGGLFKKKKFRIYLIASLLIGLGITLWIYLPLINISLSGENYLKPPINQTMYLSMDAVEPLVPPGRNLVIGNTISNINLGFINISFYITMTVLFFTLIAAIRKVKGTKFWIFIACSFYILSLGPFLHFFGVIKPLISMPYLLLYKYIPWFDHIRMAERFYIVFLIALTVIFGYGLKYILDRKDRKHKYILPVTICFILTIELLVIPINTSTLDKPEVYNRIAAQGEDFRIIEYPGSTSYAIANKANYYSTIHGKELMSGMDFARYIPGKWDIQEKTPGLNSILYNLPRYGSPRNDIIYHPYEEITNDVLNYYNIRYIVMNKDAIGGGWNETNDPKVNPRDFYHTIKFIEDNLNVELYEEDDERIVYKVDDSKPTNAYLMIGDNWMEKNKLDYFANQYERMMMDNTKIKIVNPTEEKLSMEINFSLYTKFVNFRKVEIYLNEELEGTYTITGDGEKIKLFIDDIELGENDLIFRIFDEFDKSIAFPNDNTKVYTDFISYQTIKNIETPVVYRGMRDNKVILQPVQTNYSFSTDIEGNRNINKNPLIIPEDFVIKVDDILDPFRIDYISGFYEILFLNAPSVDHIDQARDILSNEFYKDMVLNLLVNEYNVGSIMLDKRLIEPSNILKTKDYINKYINFTGENSKDGFILYKLDTSAIKTPLVVIGEQWDSLASDKVPTRNINSGSTIHVKNIIPGKEFEFSFNAWSCQKEKTRYIELFLDDELIDEFEVNESQDRYQKVINTNNESMVLKFIIYDEKRELIKETDNLCNAFINNASFYYR